MSKFLPALTGGSLPPDTAFRAARRDFKVAMTFTMQTPEGEAVLEKYKANGEVNGHKVVDDVDCARGLIAVAQEAFAEAARTTLLSPYQKSQVLNGILRNFWTLDPRNKIARDEKGEMLPSPKLLAKA
jgi:hypothetical protein